MIVVYEAVHEAHAQNKDDSRSVITENLENGQ